MRNELGTVGAIGGMAALSTLLMGLALAIYPGWARVGAWLEKSDTPAWVQAVGSILAIIGAAGIAGWQAQANRREAVRERRRSETHKALAIDYILQRASLVVSNLERVVQSPSVGALKLAGAQIEMVQQTLRALPVFEIPSPRLVFELQRVDRDLLYLQRVILEVDALSRKGRRRTGVALFARVQKRLGNARYAGVLIQDPDAVKEAHLTGIGPLYDPDFDLDSAFEGDLPPA
jgi:hypothetical protein